MVGGIMASEDAEMSGRVAEQSKLGEAAQYRRKAGVARAAGQRAMIDASRSSKVAMSRGTAVAAASGAGGTADPTVARLMAELQAEGEYRGATALYNSEEQAIDFDNAASLREWEAPLVRAGANAQGNAAMIQGVAGGVSSLYSQYGGSGTPSTGIPSAVPGG